VGFFQEASAAAVQLALAGVMLEIRNSARRLWQCGAASGHERGRMADVPAWLLDAPAFLPGWQHCRLLISIAPLSMSPNCACLCAHVVPLQPSWMAGTFMRAVGYPLNNTAFAAVQQFVSGQAPASLPAWPACSILLSAL